MASTPYKNTLESGGNGSAVTPANSGLGGNGDPFTFVVTAGGGTVTFKDPLPWGGKGIVITTGTSATYPRWDDDASTDTRRIARRPIWLASELLGTMNVMTIYAGATAMGALTLVGPGANVRKPAIQNSAFVHQASSMSATQLALNTLYWAELAVRSTSDPAGPGVEYRILAADGVTEVATYNLAIATNASPPTRVRFGPNTSSVLALDHLDDVQFAAKSSGWLGPLAATPPTLVLTGGVRHIIDATGLLLDTTGSSVPVGSIDYSISQVAGPVTAPKQLGPGMWAIAPHSTDELTYRVVADGSLGGSDTEDYDVPALLAGSAPLGRHIRERVLIGGVLV